MRKGNTWAVLLALALSALSGVAHAQAQAASIAWGAPLNLSNSLTSSGRPAIVADGYGNVHVFWSEEIGGAPVMGRPKALIHTGNTIVYSRWDGVSWTQPTDILFVPGDIIADYAAVTVDKNNRLHVVWSGYSSFYYSTALPEEAHSAQAWSKPSLVATGNAQTQWESDIITDAEGGIHIVYATKGESPGVYHVQSVDSGVTWSSPARLSLPLDDLEIAFSNIRLNLDGVGRLHAVWQTNQQEGFGQGIYYARSTNGGADWEPPIKVAYRDLNEYGVSFPSIASIGSSELHMVYIDGAWHTGRYHRISRDGGATWSEPQHIFADFEGVNGYPLLLVDGSNRLHMVITWRTKTQIGGTYHAVWLGSEWSPMTVAVPEADDTGPGAHWTAATVRLGNELQVLWNTNFTDRAGEIWHVGGVIPGVGQLPALAVPQRETPRLPGTPAPTAMPVLRPPAQALPEKPPSQPGPAFDLSKTPVQAASVEQTLLAGLLPTLLLVLGTVAWLAIRGRRVWR